MISGVIDRCAVGHSLVIGYIVDTDFFDVRIINQRDTVQEVPHRIMTDVYPKQSGDLRRSAAAAEERDREEDQEYVLRVSLVRVELFQ